MRAPTTTAELSGYLDEVHAANPNLPLMITEFGAESVRDGPATQPGSRAVPAPLRARPPAHPRLEALRGRLDPLGAARLPRGPDLDRRRAAPWSTPPWNNKSLIEESNERKPVYFDLRKRWRATRGRCADSRSLPSARPVKPSAPGPVARARPRACWPAAASAPTTPAAATTSTTARPRWCASRTRGSTRGSRAPRTSSRSSIGDGADAPRIKFFLTAGEAEAEQFQGRGEGAEQIGGDAALRRRRQRRPARSRSRSAWPTSRRRQPAPRLVRSGWPPAATGRQAREDSSERRRKGWRRWSSWRSR